MSHSLLSTAINILQWLEEDNDLPYQDRVERDRLIGKSLQTGTIEPAPGQVLAWWQAIEDANQAPDSKQSGERLVALISLATGVLVLLGIVFGIGVAGALFTYQGDDPVNLFALLGVLVGLPLLFMIGSLMLLKVRAFIPASMRHAMAVLSPGRWVGNYLARHTSVNLFETVSQRPLRGAFARWQLLAFGQSFAIGYFVGVLIVALLLVVFTDLAFGWSTTLETDAQFVWRIFNVLALPWSAWLPLATPDLALVEASRFYRLENNVIDVATAAELGRWWPFVLMTILVYGLVPRVLLAVVSGWQVSRATRRLLAEGPQITALLDRLRAPAVSFDGPEEGETGTDPQATALLAQLDLSEAGVVIIWNGVLAESEAQAWLAGKGVGDAANIDAAERQSAAIQRENLQAYAQSRRGSASRVVIFTKGWEPPLLAFFDYLERVREVIGNDPVIMIVPLDLERQSITEEDREIWARALAARDDPRLYVASAV